MFVGKRMQKDVITLTAENSLRDAGQLIREKKIRHIPIIDSDNNLVGIVTDRDVSKASASDATTLDVYELAYLLEKIKVKDIMTTSVVSVDPGMPLEQAAKILHDNRYGGLPVVDNGKLVGIFTRNDVLQFLMDSMAVDTPCLRVEVLLPDQPGELARFLGLLGDFHYNINSLITSPERQQNKGIVTIHIATHDLKQIREALEGAGIDIISIMEQEA